MRRSSMRRRTQQMYRGGYRYSRKYRGGQVTTYGAAIFTTEKIQSIQDYDSTKQYKRGDIVADGNGMYFIAREDRPAPGQVLGETTDWRFVMIFDYNATYTLDSFEDESGIVIFENAAYKRREPAAGEAPYEVGKTPIENPMAWMLIGVIMQKTIQNYDSTKQYKLGDIVAAENSGDYFIVREDRLAPGQAPYDSGGWSKVPVFTNDSSYGPNDPISVVIFEQGVYMRVEPAAGEAPYETEKTPIENPTAWIIIGKIDTLNSGNIVKENNSGKKGNNSGKSGNNSGKSGNNSGKSGNNSGKSGNNSGKLAAPGIEAPNGLQEATTTTEPPTYSPTKVYVNGDLVRGDDGKVYKMNEAVGVAGYHPPTRPGVWEVVTNTSTILPSTTTSAPTTTSAAPTTTAEPPAYDNTKVYAKGDVVRAPDGKVYRMIEGIGAAAYPPPRPGNWEVVPNTSIILPSTTTVGLAALAAIVAYSDTKVYAKGDVVRGPDGKVYKMIDGIGVAGYPPPRPGNWELVPNAPIILPSTTTIGTAALAAIAAYSPTKVYAKGDVVRGPDGKVYKMIDGIGVAGYPPPRPGNWELVPAGGARGKGRRRRTQRSKLRRGSRRH